MNGLAPKVTLRLDFKVRNRTLGLETTLGANPQRTIKLNIINYKIFNDSSMDWEVNNKIFTTDQI